MGLHTDAKKDAVALALGAGVSGNHPGTGATHSLVEMVAWLADNGVTISKSALALWLENQGLPKMNDNDLADILRQLHLIRRGVGELAEVMVKQLEQDASRRASRRPPIARLKRVGASMSGPA